MRTPGPEDVHAAIRVRVSPESWWYLQESIDAVKADSTAIRTLFPAVGRKVGRAKLDPDDDPRDLRAWSIDDGARTLLLVALGERVGEELTDLYRYGDAAERRGLLRALPFLPVGDSATPLVEDAIRTNDTRLIAAAFGPYAFEHLDDATFAQAILKCVFLEIPVSPLEGIDERVTPELSRMLADYVHERVAAGRDAPAEVWKFIDRYPPTEELDAIISELAHPVDERRRAAERALANSRVLRSHDANL
jgi:hypothetical protein